MNEEIIKYLKENLKIEENFMENIKNNIYIIPTLDKPVKIIFEELLCSKLLNLGRNFRCKYAKSKLEGTNYTIFCSSEKCDYIDLNNDEDNFINDPTEIEEHSKQIIKKYEEEVKKLRKQGQLLD